MHALQVLDDRAVPRLHSFFLDILFLLGSFNTLVSYLLGPPRSLLSSCPLVSLESLNVGGSDLISSPRSLSW